MSASSVHMFGASHRTSANEVNENMNVNTNAERIDVRSIGHQNWVKRFNRLWPMGSIRNASSYRGGSVDIFGSTNRMTSARLNQAWARSKAMMWPECSTPIIEENEPTKPVSLRRSIPMESSKPPSLIRARKPMAATTVGVTNGSVNAARMMPTRFHSYRPNHHAMGRPSMSVRVAERMACTNVKITASTPKGCSSRWRIA